jgi:Cu(I)/Ag(I) efflux system membrane fusion protein
LLVRHGLQEGELVVTQGNFKIDSEIQIQAKPSMMTPEGGGGGGGHDHGDGGGKQPADGEHAGHGAAAMSLPLDVNQQLRDLYATYDEITTVVKQGNLPAIDAAFNEFGRRLAAVDGNQLTGHPRMLWKEFSMLLGNDAVEGRDAQNLAEADRVYLLLKGHMRRLRDQLGISPDEQPVVEHIAVSPEFQAQLADVWENYLAIQQALAADSAAGARQRLAGLESAVAIIDNESLTGRASHVWAKERANLTSLISRIGKAEDLNAMRAEFLPLSQEIGVLAKAFGFGEATPVFELHCPMAFQGKGAVWYQASDEVRNPYYGSTMLGCADRVEQILNAEPELPDEHRSHQDHSRH